MSSRGSVFWRYSQYWCTTDIYISRKSIDYLAIVAPNHSRGWFRSKFHVAREVNGASFIDKEIRTSNNLSDWLWNTKKTTCSSDFRGFKKVSNHALHYKGVTVYRQNAGWLWFWFRYISVYIIGYNQLRRIIETSHYKPFNKSSCNLNFDFWM